MIKKKLVFIGIVALIILQFPFVFSEDHEELVDICALESSPINCGDDLMISGTGFEISDKGVISFIEGGGKLIFNQGQKNEFVLEGKGVEISDLNKVVFKEGGAFLSINGNVFVNIDSGEENQIVLDSVTGKISEVLFYTNDEGGIYNIEGLEFNALPNSRVEYEDGVFILDSAELIYAKVETPVTVRAGNFLIVEEEYFLQGWLNIESKDNIYLSEGGGLGIANEEGLFEVGTDKGKLNLYFGEGFNSNEHLEENYFHYSQGKEATLKSNGVAGFDVDFIGDYINKDLDVERNFFDLPVENLGPEQEYTLNLEVSSGDLVKVSKREDSFPLISHTPSENPEGKLNIVSGRHEFLFEKGEYSHEFGNYELNARSLSVPFDFSSPYLGSEDYLLKMNGGRGYSIYDSVSDENIFSFDFNLLDGVGYVHESEEGKKLYEFARSQVGKAKYIEGGRGNVCYPSVPGAWRARRLPQGEQGFDCIGLPLTGLTEIYPDSELKDFSPSLRLKEQLGEKGWSNYIVEPSGVSGESKALQDIQDIPAGSIVFMIDPLDADITNEFIETRIWKEGVHFLDYENSGGEKLKLGVTHTYVRGTGQKNFIHAYPHYQTVVDSYLVPKESYLLVISPPVSGRP